MDSYLVILDADKIHDYVFSPRKLKLIRGGSAIQAKLNEDTLLLELVSRFGEGNVRNGEILDSPTIETGARWEVVFAGGGTTMCHFRDHTDAEAYRRHAERLFHEQTRTASITSCVTKWDGAFQSTLEEARAALELAKNSRYRRLFAGHTPYWKTCEGCGSQTAGPAPGGYCGSCRQRLDHSSGSAYFRKVNAKLGGRLKEADDFGAIAASAVPDGYLAMVYIDGDAMGKHLATRGDSKMKYRELSRGIRAAVGEGVIDACAAACATSKAGSVAPFEILLVGGDDAIVMLGAQYAVDFLVRLDSRFDVEDATFSAGIVWAHHHFPITQFLEQAEALLRSAKRRSGENTVDYRIISEAMARPEIRRDDDRSTMKPYSAGEFRRLRDAVRAWKSGGVPSNKAKELYRIAFQTEYQGRVNYRSLLAHLEESHAAAIRDGIGPDIWNSAEKTTAADLVELWDFVEDADEAKTMGATDTI